MNLKVNVTKCDFQIFLIFILIFFLLFLDKINTILAEGRNQSSLVINELGKNNLAIQNIMKQQVPTFTKMFPIQSLDALNELENTINEENEEEFVSSLSIKVFNIIAKQ